MAEMEEQNSLPALFQEHLRLKEHESRLAFLYNVVRDTQETIRFLDTKAAFCVTLLTAMMAATFGPLSHPVPHLQRVHDAAVVGFAVATLFTLVMCLRVIFPTIHLQGTFSAKGAAAPAFFLPHKDGRSLAKAIWSAASYPLGISHDQYTNEVLSAGDADLVRSMCDEVIIVSAIRQLKSDRLHAAILSLFLAIGLFFVHLLV
jgi:hypothetical protein